jgi:hypothetical protein
MHWAREPTPAAAKPVTPARFKKVRRVSARSLTISVSLSVVLVFLSFDDEVMRVLAVKLLILKQQRRMGQIQMQLP